MPDSSDAYTTHRVFGEKRAWTSLNAVPRNVLALRSPVSVNTPPSYPPCVNCVYRSSRPSPDVSLGDVAPAAEHVLRGGLLLSATDHLLERYGHPQAVRPEEQATAVGGPGWKPVGGRIGRQAQGSATGQPQHPEMGCAVRLCHCHHDTLLIGRQARRGVLRRRGWGPRDAPLRSCHRRLVVSRTLGPWARTPAGDTVTAA